MTVPVQVINLDRRPDRLDQMGQQLDGLGIGWARLPAVDATLVSPAILLERTAPDAELLFPMAAGARACAASHFAAWARLVAGEARAGAVLEDDVQLAPDLAAFLRDLSWLPEDADLVQFEMWPPGKPSAKLLGAALPAPVPGRAVRALHSLTAGSACYLITREAARRALAAPRLRVPLDHFLFNPNVSPFARAARRYIVTPTLACQDKAAYGTDIAGRRRKTLRDRLVRGWFEVNLLPRQVMTMLGGGARLRRLTFRRETGGDAE